LNGLEMFAKDHPCHTCHTFGVSSLKNQEYRRGIKFYMCTKCAFQLHYTNLWLILGLLHFHCVAQTPSGLQT
jgi:hypothetical protein